MQVPVFSKVTILIVKNGLHIWGDYSLKEGKSILEVLYIFSSMLWN